MAPRPPSHPKQPLYVPNKVGSTDVPWSSITGAPPIPAPGAHLLSDSTPDEPVVIPGPPGAAGMPGTIGVNGQAGPPGMDGEPADEWPVMIPGAVGPAGPASVGPAGATGRPGIDGEDLDDWPMLIPGPQGLQGIQGIPGVGGGGSSSTILTIEDALVDDFASLLGLNGTDSGTPGRLTKWGGGGSRIVDSLLSESGTDLTAAARVLPSVDNTWDIGAAAQRVKDVHIAGIAWLGAATNAGIHQNAANELTLNATNAAGVIKLRIAGADRWQFDNAGHQKPSVDNTQDIGESTGASRLRNGFFGGYVHEGATHKCANADQATFVNAQTNITNLSFPIGGNEIWLVEVVISCTMVLATGVKFYFTFPLGTTGEIHYGGNIAAINTWQTLYQAVLTVPGTFFITGAVTGQYTMRATIRSAATTGTIQVVGITGGATTTCAVKKGSLLTAKRQS